MNIEPQRIREELQQLAGSVPVKVKLNRELRMATSIRESDRGLDITLNPTLFRSPKKLETHLNFCRKAATQVGGRLTI